MREKGELMGYIVTGILLWIYITGGNNTELLIPAGLFAIAGALSFKK